MTHLGLMVVGAAMIAATGAFAQTPVAPAGTASLNVVSYRDLPFRTVVRQRYDFSCGSAALATLLRHHYGRDVREKDVFEAMYALGDPAQIEANGFSLLDMKRYAEAHGYAADGFRLTLDELAASQSPAIVMVNTAGYRHFVVLKGISADRVLIGDPALGLKIYSREAFAGIWNGVAFRVRDRSEAFNQASDWSPWAGQPLDLSLPQESLASFTQQLPPLYQVTTRFPLDPYLR